MEKKIFAFVLTLAFFAADFLFAQKKIFDDSWNAQEIQNLQNGKIVIRNIRKAKKISIQKNVSPHVDKMLETFFALNPSYLAEIIYKMPREKNPGIYEQAVQIFSDVDLYKKIIYTDEKKGKSRPLFPVAEVRSKTDNSSAGRRRIKIDTRLRMDMLSAYDSQLEIIRDANGFYFVQKNKEPLKWKSINAVKAENMVAAISCFEYDGSYYVYALGGINAPRIPLLTLEIERQFIGRIGDFTVFYIRRFEIRR